MIDEIIVFTGSKKDFNALLDERIDYENDEVVYFMELIQHYNARLHPTESGVKEIFLKNRIETSCCVCRSDDYGSVLEHVLPNFTNIVSLNYNIGRLFIHNPPKKVLESLKAEYGETIEYLYSDYKGLDIPAIKTIYNNLNTDVCANLNIGHLVH